MSISSITNAAAVQKKLIKITDFLYKTENEQPHINNYKTSAYLIIRPEGNILIYNSSNLFYYIDHIENLGGISHHYLSHKHEYGDNIREISHKFNFTTEISEKDKKSTGNDLVSNKVLNGDEVLISHDFKAYHTPGHTEGSYTFIFTKNSDVIIFTGDTIFINKKNNLDYTKYFSSNINKLKMSILMLKNAVSPTMLVPSGSFSNKPIIEFTQITNWRDQIDFLLTSEKKN